MEVGVEVERAAQALQNGDGACLALDAERPSPVPIEAEQHAQRHTEHAASDLGVAGHLQTPVPRQRQHPLSDGDLGEEGIDPAGGEVAHPATATARADAALLVRERDQRVVVAAHAGEPGEALRQVATVEQPLERLPHEGRQRVPGLVGAVAQHRHALGEETGHSGPPETPEHAATSSSRASARSASFAAPLHAGDRTRTRPRATVERLAAG